MMRFNSDLLIGCLALSTGVASKGHQLSAKGLLQIPPSFAGDGIFLYPAHHPDHDTNDLGHLAPRYSNELYYSQEGHRPAIHGSKHGSLKAIFIRPTVVLDHSSHLRKIRCSPRSIKVCFTSSTAFEAARSSWHLDEFNLATYHTGCGDETSGKRTFYHAQKGAAFDTRTLCADVAIDRISEQSALDSAEIRWGTYQHPQYRKRVPTRGHIHIDQSTSVDMVEDDPVDITRNTTALQTFFHNPNIDTSHMQDPIPASEDPGFIDSDSTILPRHISQRGFFDLFDGLKNGIKSFINSIEDFFKSSKAVASAAQDIINSAISYVKNIQSPFKVQFEKSYHNDFNIDEYLESRSTSGAPPIFGLNHGYSLLDVNTDFNIQCTKCGIHGDFSVEGHLAFSLSDGLTKGRVVLVNKDNFTIDAQVGFSMSLEISRPVKKHIVERQLASYPLTPLRIPGIVALGPQVSISSALDVSLGGQGQLLVGGSFHFSPGTATLSLISKEENQVQGLDATFNPIFKASASIAMALELSLPIALEIGIDVLNGKYKKTVSLIDSPSIYALATLSHNEGHKCDNGIELRVGIRSQISISAFKAWDRAINSIVLYEKGIGCVNSNGFDPSLVEEDESIFDKVIAFLGEDPIGTSMPTSTDVASNLAITNGEAGFRIIMDESGTSILVSGTDGFIYLVPADENYDVSAPWGTIDTQSDIVDMDVFGRIMSTVFNDANMSSARVKVYKPTKVPSGEEAASIAELKTPEKNYHIYGLALKSDSEIIFHYPTFCPTTEGLRLYGTKYLIDGNGKIMHDSEESRSMLSQSLEKFGVKDPSKCRTVKLTSNI